MNRHVWALAAPIMLSNVSVPLLGAVDTAVVGHLPGAYHIGAVAIGAMIFNFIYWGFGFLRMGTTGLTAQALGARDTDEVRSMLARAIFGALILGFGVIALQWPLQALAFNLIEASAQVENLARDYYQIRIWGAPAAFANFALVGWFIGVRNARAAMIMQLLMNGLNVVLDLWFVNGLGWGVGGVAWASLISEFVAIAAGLMLARRSLKQIGGHWIRQRIFDTQRLLRLLAVNGDIFIRTLCLQAGFVLFTAQAAKMGDTVLAANAILLNFQGIMAYALDGFAHAVEALAGGFLGARDRPNFRQAVKTSSVWALGFAVLFTMIYAAFGGLMIDIMTNMDDIRALTRIYMPWLIVMPILSVWGFQLDGIFIGATRTADMRNAMIISLIIFVVAVALLVPGFGNHGLWAAMSLFMIGRALTLGYFYPALERSVET